jgi:hypothetical protein
MRATYPAHLILLDLITRVIVSEKYISWSHQLAVFVILKQVIRPEEQLAVSGQNTMYTAKYSLITS